MAEPSWQEQLRLRLSERNAREATYKPIIDQCMSLLSSSCPYVLRQSDRRLAQQTKLLKERNASLLRAVSAVKASGGGGTAQGGAEE